MKNRNTNYWHLLWCLFCPFLCMGQSEPALQWVDYSPQEITIQVPEQGPRSNYTAYIQGPDGKTFKKDLSNQFTFALRVADLPVSDKQDGSYKVLFSPYFTLPTDQQKVLRTLADQGHKEKLRHFRSLWQLPEQAEDFTWQISVKDGAFINPFVEELKGDPLRLLLPPGEQLRINPLDGITAALPAPDGLSTFTTSTPSHLPVDTYFDQVILDDLIVDGSACIGFDCVDGESFGFSTLRLKENNLRIEFLDTSTTASFGQNDWEILVNDSTNGGLNRYTIHDRTNGRLIFTIEAGARSNALYVEDSGEIGFGTNQPSVLLHGVLGNTPTLRLEQDGSSGFNAQIWDVAGNEAGFFVRDVTNASALSFRIQPGSPADAFFIKPTGVEIRNDIKIDGSILPISDARIKTGVATIPAALPLLRKLEPKSYHFRQDGLAADLNLSGEPQYGLLAQEVQKVIPALVQEHMIVTDETGEEVQLYGINYQGLIPLLLKGMQEQQALIEQQQAELTALRQKAEAVDDLYEKLEQLSAQVQALQNRPSVSSSTNQQ